MITSASTTRLFSSGEADARTARAAVRRYNEAQIASGHTSINVYRRRRLVLAAVVASIACCIVLLGAHVGQADAGLDGARPDAPVYVVQPGDTLWTIARRLVPDSDPRELVGKLSSAAGGPDIVPGQRIELPRRLG